jgi:isopentenyl diphosphate isomerase/L-lactate dehydrogenase-like FMN-dependent dehydrogenase
VAKALAIGANLAAAALPFLEPATVSAEAVALTIESLVTGLRIAMFASGCRRLADLPAALYEDGSSALRELASNAHYERGSEQTLIVEPTI